MRRGEVWWADLPLNTIPKATISQRICALSPAKLAEVAVAIRFALDL